MFVLPDIGGIPPDTVSTFNSHSIQINAESDFDMLDRVPTTPCGACPIPRGVVHVVSSRCTILDLESPRVEYTPWKGARNMKIEPAHHKFWLSIMVAPTVSLVQQRPWKLWDCQLEEKEIVNKEVHTFMKAEIVNKEVDTFI